MQLKIYNYSIRSLLFGSTFKTRKMSIIIKIHARQIFDSRGNPTVEVDVITENGVLGRAAVHLELQPVNLRQWNYVTEENPFLEEEF